VIARLRKGPTWANAPFMLIVLAAAIRLPTLAQQSFWTDEAATLLDVHRSFGELFPQLVHFESTPPLYFVIEWLWTHAFGSGAFVARLPSAVAGITTVWFVYRAAARIANERAGLIAGGLTALNPLLVWYSQEARAYALLAMFAAFSFWLAARAVSSSKRADLWLWALVAALALCTHYFAVFVVVPEAVWLLRCRWRDARLPVAGVGVVAAALLPLALAQRNTGHTDWITGTPLHTRLALIPKQFVTGLSVPHQTELAALALLGVVGCCFSLVADRRQAPQGALIAALITLCAPIAMGLLALAGVDLVLTRNAIGLLPVGLVAVGCGVDLAITGGRGRLALLAAALIAVVGGVSILAVDLDRSYQRPDWRDAAHVVTTSTERHLLILDPSSARLPLGVYAQLRPARGTVSTREIDVVDFLLSDQGAARGLAAAQIPSAFTLISTTRWPDIVVRRYASSSPQRVAASASELSVR
jgi:4-amino-4-deoxy-L-arabinose transferase-like glycosyltransferase